MLSAFGLALLLQRTLDASAPLLGKRLPATAYPLVEFGPDPLVLFSLVVRFPFRFSFSFFFFLFLFLFLFLFFIFYFLFYFLYLFFRFEKFKIV
jgi:hypothetical protein